LAGTQHVLHEKITDSITNRKCDLQFQLDSYTGIMDHMEEDTLVFEVQDG